LDVAWSPANGDIDVAALVANEFDAIIHLGGENILGRWTEEKRAAILDSRVDGTSLLARTIADLEPAQRPAAFLCASATGFYGSRGDELLTEQVGRGTGFLADVATAWEAAADPARATDTRVAHVRIAAVYTPRGGALKSQLLPAKLGLNGPVGNGRQWSAWIGLHDLVRIWLYVLDTPAADGIINAVGPTPARNREIAKALGRGLHRPAVLPVPVPLLKLALGGQLIDEMLLASQKVVPTRLEALGFQFEHRTIDAALQAELRA
ncbi:MAG: TIGR01777 family protein, partial [Thermoleophilia bacterium]|nr:TIGR01777 family protein [Thermoleophilia bacterium]